MQRSQLQQLCVKNQWQLPNYVNLKDGPDHKPCFTAIVTVNGSYFKSSNICHTLKAAQNSAAQVALDHFCGSISSSGSGDNRNSPAPNSLPEPVSPASQNGLEAELQAHTGNVMQSTLTPSGVNGNKKSLDGHHWYKNRLQTCAKKKNLHLPTYSTECLGPPHACRFKSKVTVGGQSFEGSKWFPTLKEAENDVAMIAFEQVSQNEYKDDCLHKNALQELAHRRGFLIPTYKTESQGPGHSLTFLSTVMIGGKFYHGQVARNKKQAEANAAKSAYDALQNATNIIKCQTQLVNPCVVSEESKEQTAGKMPRSPTPCKTELEAREVSKEQTADTGKIPRSPTPFENELEAREEVSKEEIVDSEKRPRSQIPSEIDVEARGEGSEEQTVDTRKRPRSPTPCENELETEEVIKAQTVDFEKRPRSPTPCENELEARKEVSKEQTVDTEKRPRSPTPCENELLAREEATVKRPLLKILVYPWPKVPNLQENDIARVSSPQVDDCKDEKKSDVESVMDFNLEI